MKSAGYCALCRAKEIELFGTVLNTCGPRHVRACREAGCLHPPYYSYTTRQLKEAERQHRLGMIRDLLKKRQALRRPPCQS